MNQMNGPLKLNHRCLLKAQSNPNSADKLISTLDIVITHISNKEVHWGLTVGTSNWDMAKPKSNMESTMTKTPEHIHKLIY